MSRIRELFARKAGKVLSIFYTAGYPGIEDTCLLGEVLSSSGVDMLEIGFPFSDSLVDGPTIQIANEAALEQGMTFAKYFADIKELRQKTDCALVSMCCLNPILQFGVEKYAAACKEVGIDGVLIADLPPEEFEKHYIDIFKAYQIDVVMLVTAHSSPQRIRYIDSITSGFLYVVSSDAITGKSLNIDSERQEYFSRLKEMNLNNPLVVGFGISDHDSFTAALKYLDGAIIGSAFLRAIAKSSTLEKSTKKFISNIIGE